MKLKNKNIVLVGGNGNIGKFTFIELIKQGANVAVLDLSFKNLKRLILKNKIQKRKYLFIKVDITRNSLKLYPSPHLKNNIAINTYNDHRMAMAFAPLALKVPIIINDSQVVSKSYPTFWDDLKSIDFIKEII